MYRVFLLSLGLVLVVSEQGMHGCGCLLRKGMKCCNKELGYKTPVTDEIKQCYQMKRKPSSCDADICVAKILKYASADGTIDKIAFTDKVEKEFEDNPELADAIKEKCINGDLSKYGHADFCELQKIKMCSDIEIVKTCDDWKDDGDCKGMKDKAAECLKQFE